MAIKFSEFPLSYRMSQGAVALASLVGIVSGQLFGPDADPILQNPLGMIVLALFASSLMLANYVIIRFPYISLIEPEDGDFFRENFSVNPKLYWLPKGLAIIFIAFLMVAAVMFGPDTIYKWLAFGYLGILLAWLFFHLFWYDPLRHPTIATFIRSTVGIGILLFPFFVPAIVIGSIRCKAKLDSQTETLD